MSKRVHLILLEEKPKITYTILYVCRIYNSPFYHLIRYTICDHE